MAGIVLTGSGCFKGGNITPDAGFNISDDPEAAQIVFQSGLPPVVMPPDVPHKAPTPRAWGKEMRRSGPPSASPSPPGPMSSNASTPPIPAAKMPPCTILT